MSLTPLNGHMTVIPNLSASVTLRHTLLISAPGRLPISIFGSPITRPVNVSCAGHGLSRCERPAAWPRLLHCAAPDRHAWYLAACAVAVPQFIAKFRSTYGWSTYGFRAALRDAIAKYALRSVHEL